MFLDFWKLREQPFGVTPDPRYLYFSPGHREALAALFYGIETGRGFLSLVAPPGMGKTTLLFQLLQRWKGYVHSAFLFQTQCDSRELIRYLVGDLGLKNDTDDIVRLHADLNEFLFRETKAGRRIVVFIDEAQNLSDSVLETVRLLSNFEAPDKKLLQIVLTGQPELMQRLSRPGLSQLRQRIAVQARLDPLSTPEVVRYVNHRLHVAGYRGPELFAREALGVVSELSRGIPRVINVLCFNALSLGFAMRRPQIDSEVVYEAARDSTMDASIPSRKIQQLQATQPIAQATPQHVPQNVPQNIVPRRVRFLWESVSSWMKQSISRRRLAQSSVLFLLLGSVAVYVGAPSKGRTTNVSTGAKVSAPTVTETASTSPAPQLVPAPSTDPAPLEQAQDVHDSTRNSFIYVVQPHDTMRDLCMSTFGRYDDAILKEVRRLNPNLKDLSHLAAGQEIRLPVSLQKEESKTSPLP